MRRLLTLTLVAAAATATALTSSPAGATGVTFTLAGGALSIAEPASTATLTPSGSLGLGAVTVDGALGTTTVTDSRGLLVGDWTAKIKGINFVTGGGTAGETIAVGNAKAYIDGTFATTGTVVPVTQALLPASGLSLTTVDQTLVTATGVVGSNSVTFTPKLQVTVPTGAVVGTYTGTVTQTVN